jgi:hypothetical protein
VTREALLVLGMHRSGTSALAGLLVRLGAQGPRTLMPADASNPKGYWESTAVCDFHERLLRALDSRWDTYTQLDPDWYRSHAALDWGIEGRGVIRAEFGDASRFVLKDPRMCRLLPFWLPLFAAEAVAPVAILALRNPLEVASSLAARDGLDRELSLAVWLRHVLDAERDTRDTRRTFVRYADLLTDWRGVARGLERDLGGAWSTLSPTDEAEVQRFVHPDLRHHDAGDGSLDVAPALADWVQRTSAALDQLHGRDAALEATARETLDGVRHEFDRATSAIGGFAERQRTEARIRIDAIEATLRALEQRAREAQAEGEQLRAEGDGLRAEREHLRRHAGSLEAALSATQQRVDGLLTSVSWRITAPLRAAYDLFR